MSGRGKREKVLRSDAARWRDKVCADIASAAGCAAMSEHRISAQLVDAVVDAVVRYMAAGDNLIVEPSQQPPASGRGISCGSWPCRNRRRRPDQAR